MTPRTPIYKSLSRRIHKLRKKQSIFWDQHLTALDLYVQAGKELSELREQRNRLDGSQRKRPGCWNCGKQGHIMSHCTKPAIYGADESDESSIAAPQRQSIESDHVSNSTNELDSNDPLPSQINPPEPPVVIAGVDEYYYLDEILDSEIRREKLHFKVKWTNRRPDRQWYSAELFKNAPLAIADFYERYPDAAKDDTIPPVAAPPVVYDWQTPEESARDDNSADESTQEEECTHQYTRTEKGPCELICDNCGVNIW